MEGGRSAEAVTKDCCYKNVDNKIGTMQDDINALKLENNSLQNQLKGNYYQFQNHVHLCTIIITSSKIKQDEAVSYNRTI